MGKVIVGMTMSLDGFINDRNGSVEALYPDLATLRDIDPERIHPKYGRGSDGTEFVCYVRRP